MTTAAEFIYSHLKRDGIADPQPWESFVADYGYDSLDTVELAMAIEDEFGIEIRVAEAEQVRTVADAIALVEKTIKEQSNG